MDFSLRCNSLKCRTTLNDRAVVTTCSHIFCVPCSESLGLANPNGGARICPACETHLSNPDDAVVTQLNPTEDYKTSVLSGLSPSVIMECAGRGLAFYSYQATQEIVYQEFLARSLTDKYSALSSQMDKLINDANSEITGLRDKLAAMHEEQKTLEEKNDELAKAFREKAKGQAQLQKLYSSLKQQQVAGGLQLAAEHDAENVIQTAADVHLNINTHRNGQPSRSRGSHGSGGNGNGIGSRQHVKPWENQVQLNHGGSSRSAPVNATPSSHRTRLLAGTVNTFANDASFPQRSQYRSVLNNLDPNVYQNHNTGYGGISPGIKMGRQQNVPMDRRGAGGRPSGVGGYDYR